MKEVILGTLIVLTLTACGGSSDNSETDKPIAPEEPVGRLICDSFVKKGIEAKCKASGFDVLEFRLDDNFEGKVENTRTDGNSFYFVPLQGEKVTVWAMQGHDKGYSDIVTFTGEDIKEPQEPEQPPVSGQVVLKNLNIAKYKAIATTDASSKLRSRSSVNDILQSKFRSKNTDVTVGITSDNTVEILQPSYAIVDKGSEEEFPIICEEEPPIKIERINDIGGSWKLALVNVPSELKDCEAVAYDTRYFISHPQLGAFEYPKGYSPEYAYQDNNNVITPFIVKGKGSRNLEANPLVIASVYKESNINYGMYELVLPTDINEKPQLKLLVPNYKPKSWRDETWALKHDGFIYYVAAGNLVNKVEIDSGRIVNSWTSEYVDTPFVFKGKLYMAILGDTIVELLDEGKLGDRLPLPTENVDSNSYAVQYVIDDRFIIGDRCVVWDMEGWTAVMPQRTGGNGDSEFKDGVLFCSGRNYPSHQDGDTAMRFGGSSVKLGEVVTLQQKLHPYVDEITETLKLKAPFIHYQFSKDNVFEKDTITFNLITGEELVETHYYDGEKVVDFTPIN